MLNLGLNYVPNTRVYERYDIHRAIKQSVGLLDTIKDTSTRLERVNTVGNHLTEKYLKTVQKPILNHNVIKNIEKLKKGKNLSVEYDTEAMRQLNSPTYRKVEKETIQETMRAIDEHLEKSLAKAGNEVKFLDIMISKDPNGTNRIGFYRKKESVPMYAHATSYHPQSTKLRVIYNEALRLKRDCSNTSDFECNISRSTNEFIGSGYRRRVINRQCQAVRIMTRQAALEKTESKKARCNSDIDISRLHRIVSKRTQ
ncbi:hypothetical protein GJ496_007396 [Pomphorhynchus laevis]|nr:hypothetical protein GJ496_007396 [Pomphorhynchus laevis]